MNRIGRSELNYGEHRSIDDTLALIDEVTLDEVNAVARRLLTRPFGAAVLGPLSDQKVAAPAASGHRRLIGNVGPVNRLSRRSVLAGGLAVAGLAAFPQKPVLGDPSGEPVADRIEALQRRYHVKIGVYAVDLADRPHRVPPRR